MHIIQSIQNRIYEIRGERVMLDFDLAEQYEVETKRLNEAVKRNIQRFPPDFMFQLAKEEVEQFKGNVGGIDNDNSSRSQIATLKSCMGAKYQIPAPCFYRTRCSHA
jgi:ORF6N domain